MLGWALTFFIFAVIAGVFGFGGLAGTFAWAAHLLFVAFLVLFAVTIIANLANGRKSNPPV